LLYEGYGPGGVGIIVEVVLVVTLCQQL